ncbi:alpha-N-arabinofuranosidase [Chitinophaga sp. Mgbs1]|uniref:non-reducing end alpha-L-arabinofuranosidase n=1 Tax=Chitinophaga solisilvae TaxID=1233460 RepID=A0A3S1BJV0_9BACT|nr:alpha-N-arabinofuranosidase [Chitinophaga solisilvae]
MRYLICNGLLILMLTTNIVTAQNEISFRKAEAPPVISRHIYGHFAEHLGRCIYDGFYVGDTSRIANTGGVRNDVIAALRRLKIPNLRWPGGCFADTYHWKDGIGPRQERPSIVNTWWGNVTENNSFGTHEFLNMCEVLGAMPYLAGNIGSGAVQELSDWVQYVNFDGVSPMSDLRRVNGRPAPWKVHFWGVGNEAWGCGGHMRPEYYADEYRKYATFMNTPDIFRIASGANSADYNWTAVLMKNIPLHLLQGIALHHYAVINWDRKGDAVEYTDQQYFQTMQSALRMDTLIQKHSAIMDQYDPAKKVALVVDEWGGWYNVEAGTNPGFLYQQNTMRDAMIAGATLNIFNNHADRVRMANLAQTVNVLQAVILTQGSRMLLTPTYHVMEMYAEHQDATLIPLDVHSNAYTQNGQQLPAISASASVNKRGMTHISLVNIDPVASQEVVMHTGSRSYTSLSGRILTAARLRDYNSFGQPEKIKPAVFKQATLHQQTIRLQLPPFSVVMLELQ